MKAHFYCIVCNRTYQLRFLSLEELSERDHLGLMTFPLMCPAGHSQLVRV